MPHRSPTRLTVAVDGRPLQGALGGVGRHVATWLPAGAAEVDVVLLTDPRRPAPVDLPGVTVEPIPVPARLPALAWLEVGAGRWLRRRSVLFHGTFYATPFSYRGPSVTDLHDISWETHPEDFPPAKRQLWIRYGRHAARRSGRIITLSEFSRTQIVDTYGLDPGAVVIAPVVVDPHFRPEQAEHIDGHRAGLDVPERFVVTLGGARRRGLAEAVEAWRRARAVGGDAVPDLVVVGREAPPTDAGIHWLGRVDDDAWASVLAAADALIYATRFEGWGLPAAEAAASGTPVVCAPVASVPEVLGDAGAWATEPTGPALGTRLAELMASDEQRAELRARGLARTAAAPGTDVTAAVIVKAYRAAWAATR